ncbi:BON domain-containing protein [Planctomycetes bacterium K23_9]|uniref:BON domain protein n=1 Tax=Stieleria marina TaxID=1930275 RepID=A0A517NXM8_9BACT|nr:BON domain protein [Planctomycetes bacterium K23_9]
MLPSPCVAPVSSRNRTKHCESNAAACETALAIKSLVKQTGNQGLVGVQVVVHGQQIILSGRVSSFYLKQVAQEAVRPMSDGLQIDNRLEVAN